MGDIADVLVAMAPLNEAEIRTAGKIYQEDHLVHFPLDLSLEHWLQGVEAKFEREWGPVIAQEEGEDRSAIEMLRRERLEYEKQHFFHTWANVIASMSTVRERVYRQILWPVISGKVPLTSKWLMRQIAEYAPTQGRKDEEVEEAISPQTLSRWRSRGLLINDKNGHPNFDSTTSILMMRLLRPTRFQGFLPSGNYQQAPAQFCYRRDTPESPIVACGLPLDRNQGQIPKHALLFSPLSSLAKFRPDWLEYEGWSIRWAGTVYENRDLYWDLDEEALALWDPEVKTYKRKILGETRVVRHTLANLVLFAWASQVITSPGYRLPD